MKIYDVGKEGLKITRESGKVSRKPSDPQGKSGVVRKDQVQLSKDVQRLMEIENQEAKTPEVREDVVERLKAEMSRGTYQPDNKKVADKMRSKIMGLPSEE